FAFFAQRASWTEVFSCRDLGFNLPCLLEVERLEGAKLERLPPVSSADPQSEVFLATGGGSAKVVHVRSVSHSRLGFQPSSNSWVSRLEALLLAVVHELHGMKTVWKLRMECARLSPKAAGSEGRMFLHLTSLAEIAATDLFQLLQSFVVEFVARHGALLQALWLDEITLKAAMGGTQCAMWRFSEASWTFEEVGRWKFIGNLHLNTSPALDWAVKQAPPIRCLFVHALRLCRRSSSSKSLKIKMLKESMEVIISASGESPHDGIEAALANASLQAPQAPNPDEMETQQLVDDLEKLMNDDLMCDDATPEVAVDPKVDGYRRQAAKEMHCMEAIPPEMPDKTDLEMTELMENPPDAYQAQLVAEKAKKIQHAEQLLKNAQSDGKVKNKFSKPGRGRGKGRGRGRAVDNSVADPKPSEPAGESNGNDPTPEPEGGGSGSGEPAGGDPNIEVAPKKGRNHLTQSELQKMWSEKAPLLRAAAIPVPADFDPTSKKSFTLPPPDDKKCGSVGILWTLDQIYVSAVTNKEADESIRVNKKDPSNRIPQPVLNPFAIMALGLSKRKACALLFWGAPVLLIHLVDYCCQVWAAEHGDGPMQDLQMLELFSGEQELTRQCRLNGIECRAMDIRKDKVLHDLTSSRGFCLALLRWVWISASTTKRRSREHGIFGDEGLEGVRVEQPSSSCLPKCPYVAHVMTNMEQPLDWKHADLPALRQFLLEEIAANRVDWTHLAGPLWDLVGPSGGSGWAREQSVTPRAAQMAMQNGQRRLKLMQGVVNNSTAKRDRTDVTKTPSTQVATATAGGISISQMQAIATPQKVPVTTDPHPQATLDDTLVVDDDNMETPEPVHTSKSPEPAAEHSQGFDKTQQTPKTRAYLACMQRKSTDDLSLPKTPEHPTAEAAPVIVTPVAARPAHSTPAVVTPTPPVVAPAHVLTAAPGTASAEAPPGSTAVAPAHIAPAATPTPVVAPAHVLTPTPFTASAEAPPGSTAVAPAPIAPAATPTPVVAPAHVLTPTPVTASAEAPPGSTAVAPAPIAPAATPTPVVAPAHVLTPTPVTASAEAPPGSTAVAPVHTAPAATPTPVVAPAHALTPTPVTASAEASPGSTAVAPAHIAPAATPTPVVAPAHVLTPTPVTASAEASPGSTAVAPAPIALAATQTPLEPEPQSPDPRLLQFWSRFKRSPMSREPLVRPLPPPTLNLPAPTEALYTVLDPLNWKHLIRSNVGHRSDWRSCFVVAAYNHNTIFTFANERGEIDGTPQVSDFPLVVCKGAFPTEPIAVAAPHLVPAAAATTLGMPTPAPLAMTPPAIVDRADLPEVTQKFHEASKDKAKMRSLFQEFQRCNGDWLSSTLVIRDSQTTTNTQGGKDLLVKYHGNTLLVDELIKKKTAEKKYISHPEFPDNEDMRLYKTWVETYEKNEEIHAEGVETRREAEGDYDGMGSTPIPPGDSQAVPKAKPKPKPKSSAPKVKTDEQLARAAVVKANANLLEISQWDYKLANASVPKVVRDAYVSSMETEGKELRDAKTAVELALSLGQSLKEPTEKLESANENYRKSSGQVKKACVAPKATSCAELQKAAHASVKEAEAGATVNACPLGLYGDDCLDLSRFPLFLLRVSRMVPDYSLTRVYQLLMWSFNVARRGYVSCEEIGSGAEKPLLYPPTGVDQSRPGIP
ncbi:unnamed protein product, partial [Cladocopium goreaui]